MYVYLRPDQYVVRYDPDNGGPWHVILFGQNDAPIDPWAWYIVNTETGLVKKIGPVKLHGLNYYDRAVEVARQRNEWVARRKAALSVESPTLGPRAHYPEDGVWVLAKAKGTGHPSRYGPFETVPEAARWADENRPESEWEGLVIEDHRPLKGGAK